MSRRAAQFGLGLLLLAATAQAYVPPAKHVAGAVAKANRAAKRDRALAMQVSLHRGDAETPLAEGRLIADPSGKSRLELREGQHVERHLRDGARLEATRDGRAHQAMLLPPLHLLQLDQRAALQTALAELGGSAGAIELGHDGDLDAYVLGARGGTALWVDIQSLSPARLDLPGGVTVRLGPLESHDGILWPAWLSIEQAEGDPLRLEFRAVSATVTDPQTFRRDWLFGDSQPLP